MQTLDDATKPIDPRRAKKIEVKLKNAFLHPFFLKIHISYMSVYFLAVLAGSNASVLISFIQNLERLDI